MHLRTLFPRHPRPRTVVHVGPLLAQRSDGASELRRYLRTPGEREVFLVHQGGEPWSELAADVGVTDITLESATADAEAEGAAEMAVALGARRLDFTIDDPAITDPHGAPLRELTLREAERLAGERALQPRIRAKLHAGCEAMRHGLSRVRFGSPESLRRDRATVLVPDPALSLREDGRSAAADGEALEPDPPAAFRRLVA